MNIFGRRGCRRSKLTIEDIRMERERKRNWVGFPWEERRLISGKVHEKEIISEIDNINNDYALSLAEGLKRITLKQEFVCRYKKIWKRDKKYKNRSDYDALDRGVLLEMNKHSDDFGAFWSQDISKLEISITDENKSWLKREPLYRGKSLLYS